MCGRFIQISNPEKIKVKISELEIDETVHSAFKQRYNIAPTQNILTVLNYPTPTLTYTRWGLIPFWAKDITIGNKMINARSETLLDKPSFKTPLRKRRCIIFADGFYEWKSVDKIKTPYFIHLKDCEPFALAGLWDEWMDKTTCNTILSSTIITTAPNDLVGEIHSRMPVILESRHYKTWLNPGNVSDTLLMDCLKIYSSDEMEAYEISRTINNPAYDNPECIRPYSPEENATEKLF
jgi:putative SOS response-associated peptidase YedK